MPAHLARDLAHLQGRMLHMARLAEEAVEKATAALRTRDPAMAAEVLAGDSAIDEQENGIQDECLKILALHQPVAGDLRLAVAAFSITTDLERIGDLASSVAKLTAKLTAAPPAAIAGLLERMTDLVNAMLRQAIDAYVNQDSRQAARVVRQDDEVDRYHDEVVAAVTAAMKASPDAVEPGLALFGVARHLERIGDHVTNMAEDVVYLVDGEAVRRQPDRTGH